MRLSFSSFFFFLCIPIVGCVPRALRIQDAPQLVKEKPLNLYPRPGAGVTAATGGDAGSEAPGSISGVELQRQLQIHTCWVRQEQYNQRVAMYNEIVDQANRLFSRLDGQRRGLSTAGIASQVGIAASGVTTAALTAAAPAANAAWIQGLTGFNTGVNSVRSEFGTQRLTSEAVAQVLRLVATEINSAREKINFPEAEALVGGSGGDGWARVMKDMGEGLRNMEKAVVLAPMTYSIRVEAGAGAKPARGS